MKYTNKHNFPSYIQEWLENDSYDYDKNTISATRLLQPAKVYALTEQNSEKLEIDISDIIASRYGTAIHDSFEKVKLSNCIQEQRLKTKIEGKTLTGKFDILHKVNNTLYELIDIKSTSVWSYIYGSKEEDYIKQLSIYRFLAERNGIDVVEKAKIILVFTDWSSSKARNDSSYPQTRIAEKEITLWSTEQTEKWILERIELFKQTLSLKEKDMPECTDEELWATPDTFAVMKEGRKTAVRVFNNEFEAQKLACSEQKYFIERRKGQVKRCKYCLVSGFCEQYKNMKENGRIEE